MELLDATAMGGLDVTAEAGLDVAAMGAPTTSKLRRKKNKNSKKATKKSVTAPDETINNIQNR